MADEKEIEHLVAKAVDGSRSALEEIVREIQGPIYALSLRMLLNRTDAEDATQDILTTVITHLSGFRSEGPFRAWVMRIAVNKLNAVRKTFMEKRIVSVTDLDAVIDRMEAKGWFARPIDIPEPVILAETRFICIHSVLHMLDRPHRMAFILGVVMDVSGKEGAEILEISPAAYRKRLSRARMRIGAFLGKACGLLDDANPCRCAATAAGYVKKGWIDLKKPMFKKDVSDESTLKQYLKELDELGRISAIYKAAPAADVDFVDKVRALYLSGRFQIISN